MLQALRGQRFNPKRDLTNLKLWWDMSDSRGVTVADRSGTQKLTRTLDLTGNNNYGWIEDFDPWEPMWDIDPDYGFRFMNGSGISGDWRIPNLVVSGFSEGTGVAVVRKTADPGAGNAFWNFGASGQESYIPFSDGFIYDDFGTTARKTVGDPTPALTIWHIYSVRSMANLWKANLDGAELFSTGTNTVGFNAGAVGIAAKAELHLAAMLVFDRYLDAGTLNRLGKYLGEKFRIQWNDAST